MSINTQGNHANALSLVTIFSNDMEKACKFYQDLLGFNEVIPLRSPVFRAVDCGNLTLGFHADEAYDLLNLRDHERGQSRTIDLLITFYADSRQAIDEAASRIGGLGGEVVKPPFVTYYNHYQIVLSDTDNTVFRLSHPLA